MVNGFHRMADALHLALEPRSQHLDSLDIGTLSNGLGLKFSDCFFHCSNRLLADSYVASVRS
jgi:hypothetical protein